MLQRFEYFLRRPFLAGAGLFLVTVTVVGAALWLFSAEARRQVEALAIASGDSMQWSIDQAEIEFLSLQAAVLTADPQRPDPFRELRLRFNIFYSRVATLQNSETFAAIRALPNVEAGVRRLEDFVERTALIIDSDDRTLSDAIPMLAAEIAALRPDLRTLALAGLSSFAERAERQRKDTREALRDFGALVFLLCVVLVGFLLALMSMMYAARRRNVALALAQERLQSIVSTSLEGILVIDWRGLIVDYNGACERIFGYSAAEALGKKMTDLIIPERQREAHLAGMDRYRQTGRHRFLETGLIQVEAQSKSGRIFPIEMSIASTRGEDGEIFIAFIRNISDRVRAERELVEARDQAVAGEQAKSELLAVMSHEMRTPLNGVLGTLQLLGETALDERQRRFVAAMETSGEMLLQHVNNVLDVSRADAGKMVAMKTGFDLRQLLDSVVDGLRAEAGRRGNALVLRVLQPLPDRVSGDPPRLRQILVNLIGNAIKFTDNGTVTVEVECQEHDEVEFRVIDTGIGIAEADLGRIFDDFVTLDTSYGRMVEGTGLGLGIARRLAAVMGGLIGVESEPGEGSVFWLRLPLANAESVLEIGPEAGEAVPEAAGAGPELSVLLVEDNEINRLVARETLMRRGCSVTEATGGKAGVQAAAGRRFDLVLMDISMPDLDGIGATRLIRESGGPNAGTPIVALTAHAMPGDIRRCREAGMCDVLTKPLSVERLAGILEKLRLGRAAVPPNGGDHAAGVIAALGEGNRHALRDRIETELDEGFAELATAEANRAAATLAHRLAGLAGVAGLSDLQEALAGLEEAAAAGGAARFGLALGHAQAAHDEVRGMKGSGRVDHAREAGRSQAR